MQNQTAASDSDLDKIGESRWPMVIAVIAVMAMTFVPPALFTVGQVPVVPLAMGVLLVVLIVGDPGRIDKRSRSLRIVLLALASLMVATTLLSTVVLVVDLIRGSSVVQDAGPLLIYSTKIWLSNNVAFALLYWSIDRGGPAERVHGTKRYPDFLFPQITDPAIAAPDWRPRFIDYLYIGFTNANAFSPTDTLPLTGRAKLVMQVQALISYAILALVLARVVNAFA